MEQQQSNGKGMAIAGLVLGIIAAGGGWFGLVGGIICLICGIVGIVLSVKGKKKLTEAGQPTGIATAGLVLSIIGVVLAGIATITCGVCVCVAKQAVDQIPAGWQESLESALEGLQLQ